MLLGITSSEMAKRIRARIEVGIGLYPHGPSIECASGEAEDELDGEEYHRVYPSS
jgi:hypothetical protein